MNNKDKLSFKTVLEDVLAISPKYLSDEIDKNRLSTFGYITETMASSIEDTLYRHHMSSSNSIIELSDNDDNIRAVAKIRNLKIMRAQPSKLSATLFIRKEDIIYNGTKDGNNYHFILDKRSKLTVNDIPFTLFHDIKIKASWYMDKYVYSARYMTNETDEVIVAFDADEKVIALFVYMQQVDYSIEERTIVDLAQFTYEGMILEHRKMTDFEIEVKDKARNTWRKLNPCYYRITPDKSDSILYNDDNPDYIRLYNPPNSNLETLDELRITIKETLGERGNFDIMGTFHNFAIFTDEHYKYTSIEVKANVNSDARGGKEADNIDAIKWELINQKLSRDILVTDKDIRNAMKNKDDILLIKRRNDLRFKFFDVYQLFRNGNQLVPTATKNVILKQTDFSQVHNVSDIKVMLANNKYTTMTGKAVTMTPRNNWTSTEFAEAINDSRKTIAICPFAYNINKYNILTYYLTAVDIDARTTPRWMNDKSPYQMIITNINIKRNPYKDEEANTYEITLRGMLNGSGVTELLNGETIASPSPLTAHVIFFMDKSPKGYIEVPLTSYEKAHGVYTFKAKFTSDDYVTEDNKLSVAGLTKMMESSPSNMVIDYDNIYVDVVISHKNPHPEDTPKDEYQESIPALAKRTILSKFSNRLRTFSLMVECSKFTRSAVKLIKNNQDQSIQYKVFEVPLIKADYLIKNYGEVYKLLKSLQEYNDIINRMVDNTLNIKFINTYGRSKYIFVGEKDKPLFNLNPVLNFKIYGRNVDVGAVRERILEYFSSHKADNENVFISNINTIIEREFPNVHSIEFVSIDHFDHTHQKIKIKKVEK